MKTRLYRLVVALVAATAAFALIAPACSAAVVVYLDEAGTATAYERPEAYDPVSALELLAAPPSEEETGMKLTSAVPAGTKLIGIHQDAGAAVVNFSADIIGAGLSEARMADLYEQVRGTLWQFEMKGEIRILVNGDLISQFVPKPPDVKPSAQALADAKTRLISTNSLSGRQITLSPGHGKRWNGSYWSTARPVYCSPLNEEDYHNLENAQYLEAYLLQDGMTVKMVRCTNKSQGASPWAGGEQWWRMGSCYWLQNIGYPEAVYAPSPPIGSGSSDDTNEIQSRPLSSDYDNSDIYISLHTNGLAGDCSGTGCPVGCCTYYDAGSEHAAWGAVSQSLATAVNNNIIDTVRTKYVDATWQNRGVINSNGAYGEIRIPDRAAVLIELAFHDSCDTDAMKLRDNFFRSAAMWGVYKGICEYFGTTPTYDFYTAELVSHDIPTAMSVNEIRTVHVTLRNRGVLWQNAKGYRLGAVGDSDPFTAVTRQAITAEAGPNATYTFTFNLKAPNAVGTFTTDWQMVREGFTWFGPTVSQDIEVTGTPDNEAPAAPTGLTGVSNYSYNMNLTWNAATDNVAVVSYNIYRNNVKIGSSATTSFTDNTCAPSTTYTYEVTACDVVPNESARSDAALLTTQDPDSVAPSVPTGLHSTQVTASAVSLAWNASTDYYGVTGYNIYRNSVKIGSSAGTSYTDSTVSAATGYSYEVTAYDAMLNESGKSAAAPVMTPAAYTVIWEEGFDGTASFNNWTVVAGYVYDTAVNHGSITGAGSAYISTTAASQMWRAAASRPFAECRVSGWYYDLKGGYKSGVCGVSQRECLRLTADASVSMFIEHGIYSAPSYATYNYRTVGGGQIAWTAIGPRNPTTSCNPAWVFYETTVIPGNPGASPTGTVTLKATDGGGTVSATPNLQTDFFNNGVGRVYLGMNLTSTTAGRRWDDIKIEATKPGAPAVGGATANSASQITWTWTRADNNVFGFDIADAGGAIKSPLWPASGWKNRTATSWAETGLAANTLYTRKVRAWNGSLDSDYSASASRYTLSALPTTSNVTCDKAVGAWSSSPDFTFTAVGGFGAGKVEYYRCVWDQSPTHTWTGSEQIWDEDTTARTASASGAWYFHVRGYNAEDAANGSLDLGPYYYSTEATGTIAQAKALPDGQAVGLFDKMVVANFGSAVYIEESDGSSGIRVDAAGPAVGTPAGLVGTIQTDANGERYIADATLASGGSAAMPFVPMMNAKHLGGGALNAYTIGVTGGIGVNNIGLLVSVAGRITHDDAGFAYVDDGSLVQDGSGWFGVRVDKTGLTAAFTEGKQCVITGVSSILKQGEAYIPVLRPRGDADAVIYP